MSRSSYQEKGFLDFLSAPLTLLPLGAGLSLLIVAWVISEGKELLLFLGVAGVLVGLGVLLTQWLFAGGDPRLAQLRGQLAESLEAACRLDRHVLPEEATQTTTPAAAEDP
jgi:hypothetical protein